MSEKLLRIQDEHTDVVGTDGDTGAVGLVDDTVNELEVVRVRDHLVSGDNILGSSQLLVRGFREGLSCQEERRFELQRVKDGEARMAAALFSSRGVAPCRSAYWRCLWLRFVVLRRGRSN